MKIINKILLLMTLPSILSCGAGVGDEAVDLGSGYVYRSDGDLRWIYFKESFFEDGIEGNVKNYKYDDKFIIASQIPSEDYYKWRLTDDLIYKFKTIANDTNIAENKDIYKMHFLRSPWWSDTVTRKKIYASFSDNREHANEALSDVIDSLRANNEYFRRRFTIKINFWIIIKQKYELIGPLNKSEFEAERRRLGININFKTDDI